jgi:hypothetical protein
MVNFNELDEARRLLGLGEAATLKEIRSAYRRLAHHHHPDKHYGADEETEPGIQVAPGLLHRLQVQLQRGSCS